MNHLELRCISRDVDTQYLDFNFYIDGKALDQLLGFDKQTDLRFSDFDLDLFVVDKTRFPHYDRHQVVFSKIAQYLGNKPVYTQLDNNRLILYRCHCGCDYCSVISCDLEITKEEVKWNNITYEDGLDKEDALELNEHGIEPIEQLIFNRQQYQQVFNEYLEQYL
ncbi:hypothetical protein MMG00_04145 [Ignatzschineria rhizosphaerae]|uniref:Uncharacterized protein n=1 Tax=Ignatzschineria rhizosphaerae TaxID=2923279 RepID=A0ABY3X8J9_9GAMM|nr:hypothetical protein [Ignatzschineria rhizosphaerae]UNM97051.1 hypothetical protein MMG00_04145 [Ignatzschineria rhizosphaerae]